MSCITVYLFCYLCHRPNGVDHCCTPYETCCPDCVDWLNQGKPGFPKIFEKERTQNAD